MYDNLGAAVVAVVIGSKSELGRGVDAAGVECASDLIGRSDPRSSPLCRLTELLLEGRALDGEPDAEVGATWPHCGEHVETPNRSNTWFEFSAVLIGVLGCCVISS